MHGDPSVTSRKSLAQARSARFREAHHVARDEPGRQERRDAPLRNGDRRRRRVNRRRREQALEERRRKLREEEEARMARRKKADEARAR